MEHKYPYQIFTDATADLTMAEIEKLHITVLPMEYAIDEQVFSYAPAKKPFPAAAFYQAMREGKMVTTSQIPAAVYEDVFAPVLRGGQDILYLCFSSALTGSYRNACMAAEALRETYPQRKVLVVDSRAACRAEGLLAEECAILRDKGKSLEFVHRWAEEERSNLQHWFTVDDLQYLKRGGRISSAAAMIGGMLGIKPVLTVGEDGALAPVDKVRGREASLDYLVERFAETWLPGRGAVYVSHGDCLEDAKLCVKKIKEKTEARHIEIVPIGPIVGAHTGPGIVGILYLGAKRPAGC